MEYRLIHTPPISYIELLPGNLCLQSEQDALDCVAACGENDTHRLMLHADNLSPKFFDLKTGLAGQILLKFSMYSLKVAAVIHPEVAQKGRFGEMVLEANRSSREFRVFPDAQAAAAWLIS